MRRKSALFALACVPIFQAVLLFSQSAPSFQPLRSAVPLLCTETNLAARTRVRGSGVIVDSGGTLLTAGHVIEQARSTCTLSVLIPDDEWNRPRGVHAFLIGDCHLNQPLDLALCRIKPAGGARDWAYIRAARIGLRQPVTGEPMQVTAFTGWGLLPLTRSGRIQARNVYRREDGCYCDFAIDIAAQEGMSGSPVTSASGEVLGILTVTGRGQFRGLSFGASLLEATAFLKSQGIGDTSTSAGRVEGLPGHK